MRLSSYLLEKIADGSKLELTIFFLIHINLD
jgi:hypothetical protein